jgi:hypothetical protein
VPVKSIIDIDVNDAKFAAFKAQFDKYHAALGKQSEMWAKAGKSQTEIANHWKLLTAKMMTQQHAKQETADEGKKAITNLRQSDSLWTSMQRSTKDVAKNIAGATTSLLRWTGILGAVSGLFGAGGLYGIDRMAASASSQRQSAMGRGLSVGEQSAFTTNFGRIFGGNADPFLSNVNEMMSDPRKSWSLATLGVANTGKTEDVAVNLLKAMRQRAKGTSDNQLGLLDTQTGVGAGTQVWRTLHDMSDKEFDSQVAKNQRDVSKLNVNDPTLKAWQDFTDQMHRAGQQLENVFIKGLVRLAGPLGHLSSAAIGLVETIMGSKGLKEGIKTLAGWIDSFAKDIESGEFDKSVQAFMSGIADMVDSMRAFAHPQDWLNSSFKPGSLPDKLVKYFTFKGTPYEGMDPEMFGGGGSTKAFGRYRGDPDDLALGLPNGTVRRLAGVDPDMFGGGATGANDAERKRIAERLESLERYYRKWTDTDNAPSVQKAMASYAMGGPDNFDKILAAHPTDWQKNIPADAQRLVLTINNNTGGNAVAVVNAQQ